MTWFTMALKFRGAILAPLRAFFRWLGEDFRHVIIAGLAVLTIGAAWTTRENAQSRDIAQDRAELWQNAAEAERTARLKLIEAVRLGRIAAAEADAANAARVKREMAANTERTADDYQARIADRDAAYRSLQHQLDATGTGNGERGGGAEDVSGDLTARCRALGAADCHTLLAALPGLLAEAEGNTAKLIALQGWVRGLLDMDLSGAGEGAVDQSGEQGEPEGDRRKSAEGVL